jgi:hypothetical protein
MRALASVLFLLLAPPAFAAMSPEVYEAARDDASDVIVVAIAGVTPPDAGADYGKCTVVGTVLIVERGSRHQVGDAIALAVDCAERDADYPDGGALYEEMQSLLRSTYGRAWLGPDGLIVLSQYDQLTEADLP